MVTPRVCSSIPIAGDRVIETGVERILGMQRGDSEHELKHKSLTPLTPNIISVPLIAVFTKYDAFVSEKILEAAVSGCIIDLDDQEAAYSYGQVKADEIFKKQSLGPLM